MWHKCHYLTWFIDQTLLKVPSPSSSRWSRSISSPLLTETKLTSGVITSASWINSVEFRKFCGGVPEIWGCGATKWFGVMSCCDRRVCLDVGNDDVADAVGRLALLKLFLEVCFALACTWGRCSSSISFSCGISPLSDKPRIEHKYEK